MFRFIRVSNNRKTGPIPVSTTYKKSCPPSCPFLEKGCYAKYSFTGGWWNRCDETRKSFLANVKRIRPKQLWRHNQAGDLLHKGGEVDGKFLAELVAANGPSHGFTYTHHLPTSHNLKLLRAANKDGFTVSLSANNPNQAVEYLKKTGLPVVSTVASNVTENFKHKGIQFLICPAVKRDNLTCADCGLCQRQNRKCVVAFPAHGTGKKMVDKVAAI